MQQTNMYDFLNEKELAELQRQHDAATGEDPIDRIVKFNKKAGLLNKPYDDFLESSFQIEEALEGLSDMKYLCTFLWDEMPSHVTKWSAINPKEISRRIVNLSYDKTAPLSDVDRLDKACDAIVFAVGSMAKLGLNSEQIIEALNIVMDSNMAKLGCPKDEHGKLTKPANFPNPEPRLQQLLDRRAK